MCVWEQQGTSHLGDTCSDVTSCVTPQRPCRDYAIAVPAPGHGWILPRPPLEEGGGSHGVKLALRRPVVSIWGLITSWCQATASVELGSCCCVGTPGDFSWKHSKELQGGARKQGLRQRAVMSKGPQHVLQEGLLQ